MNISAIVLTALSVILLIVMCIKLIGDMDNALVSVIGALILLIATISLGFIWNIFEEMDSPYQGFTNRLRKGGYIILLKEKDKPVYYIHELFHLAHDILSDRGVTLDNDGEAYAYLIGWLADQYYNVVLNNVNKIMKKGLIEKAEGVLCQES